MTTLEEIWSYTSEQLSKILIDDVNMDINYNRTAVALTLLKSNLLDSSSTKKISGLKYSSIKELSIKLAFEMENQEIFDDLNLVRSLQQYYQTKYLAVLTYTRAANKITLYSIPDLKAVKEYILSAINIQIQDFIIEDDILFTLKAYIECRGVYVEKYQLQEDNEFIGNREGIYHDVKSRCLLKFNNNALMVDSKNNIYIYNDELESITLLAIYMAKALNDVEYNSVVTIRDKIIIGDQSGIKVYQNNSYKPLVLPYKANFLVANRQNLFVGIKDEIIVLSLNNYQEVLRIKCDCKKMVVSDKYLVVCTGDYQLIVFDLKNFNQITSKVIVVGNLLISGEYLIMNFDTEIFVYSIVTLERINSLDTEGSIMSVKLN